MPRRKDMSRLSMEAEKARSVIDMQKYHIEHQLEDLSEADLKAIVDQARKDGRVYPLWTGIAAEAERRLDLLERYRSGRGKWFALVQAVDWDPARDSGRIRTLAEMECETRSAAVIAAKKLLAKHIDDLGESTRIEAYVVSEMADEIREREAH